MKLTTNEWVCVNHDKLSNGSIMLRFKKRCYQTEWKRIWHCLQVALDEGEMNVDVHMWSLKKIVSGNVSEKEQFCIFYIA